MYLFTKPSTVTNKRKRGNLNAKNKNKPNKNLYYGNIINFLIQLYRAFHNVLRDYKNYYTESIGHVFTKPVQLDRITQKYFPRKFFSS